MAGWLAVIVITDLLWLPGPKAGRTAIHLVGILTMAMLAYGMHLVMQF